MSSIAIIGAGMSGLAAAHALRDAHHTVTLYEQQSQAGGRATTRSRDGYTYDSGAQYIKPGAPASITLITERFRSPDLLDIAKPVWIFDGQGHIQPGDPAQNAEPKWSYAHGLLTLAQRMATDLNIHLNSSIAHIEHNPTGWTLFSPDNQAVGTFDRVIISIPANHAITLLENSQFDHALKQQSIQQLQQARYNPLLSVMLGYAPQLITRPYYALVNTDKQHALSWLAWEHEKSPARVPDGTGLLIAQMAPHYSQAHWEEADATIIEDVARHVSQLLDEPLTTPIFSDIQRWPDALPATTLDADTLNALTLPSGLAFCGDAFVGGRVHLALEHGLHVAQQLIEHSYFT